MKVNGCAKLWLNLNVILSKQIIIAVIYQHPHTNSNYIENFTGALVNSISIIKKRKGTFYVLGDLNIDVTINVRTPSSILFPDDLISCCSLPSVPSFKIPSQPSKVVNIWSHHE